jgi:hypothetical protein
MGHESQCWRGQMAVADDGPSTSILPYPFGTRARGRATLDARHRHRAPRLPQGAANQPWSTPPAGCPRRHAAGRPQPLAFGRLRSRAAARALPARCTGVDRGSEILVPWPKEVKEARSSFREAAQPAPPGRWRDQFSPLRGKVLVLMRSGSGSAPPAGVEGVDCVDLCRSQFGLKTSKVSAMRRGRTDFGIAPPMIGAAMPGNRAPPRGAGRCAARKQSTRGYASNGPCAPVPTSPNQVRPGG